MKILNLGSLNIDYVYEVPHFVSPGETISATSLEKHPGGKGSNQSAAAARAGADVYHVGRIGTDGIWLTDGLDQMGANTGYVVVDDAPTGSAIIQVSPEGENAIIVHGGANRTITKNQIDQTIADFDSDTVLLVQNETSNVAFAIERATAAGMDVCLNPSPFDAAVKDFPLDKVTSFVVNEIEAQQVAEVDSGPTVAFDVLCERFESANIVMTLGAEGVWARVNDSRLQFPAYKTDVVDTTAAGDAFLGFWLASTVAGDEPERALKLASKAASIAVTRKGAQPSIPKREEVNI